MSIRTKNLLSIIIIFALILPQLAFAFISPWDYVSTALGGIEEKVEHIFGVVVRIFFLYVIGLILLVTSASLLDWVVAQPQWLTLQGSQLVKAGFAFTAGIANIFLILIFIIIAFAYILRLETFQAKKSLPKLIMVALLINFSLVFIGMIIDISNIFYNTILKGNEGLANIVMKNLVGGMWGVLLIILGWFGVFAASALIPLVHSLPLQVGALVAAGAIFLPNMVTWVFQLILAYLMAGIFFLYVFLFAVRVFVIQILAILSPLAFLCLILPQTEKHWREWLQHLVQWVSLGIFLLFFLILGLKASTLLMPPGGPQPLPLLPLLPWFTGIDKYFVYYFFLFIYMILALRVSERTMPALASFMIEQTTLWGTRVARVGKPLLRATRRQLRETLAESETIQKWAREQALGPPPPPPKGWRKLAIPIAAPIWALRREIGRALGPAAIEAVKGDISRIESEAEKIKTPDLLESKFLSATTDTERIAYFSAAIKKGGPFKEALGKYIDQAILAAQAANKLGAGPEAERIARGFIHKLDEEKLKRMGFKSFEELSPEKQMEWKAKGYRTIIDSLVGEAKGDEIKDFAKGFWRSPEVMEAIQKFWGGSQLRKAAEEFGREFVDVYTGIVEKLKAEVFIRINPRAALYLAGSAAQVLGFRPPEGLGRGEIRRLIKEMEEKRKGKER